LAERYTDNRDFIPIVRNLELKPELSQTFELGARVGIRNPSGSSIVLDAAFFTSAYSDLIEPRLVPAEQAFQFVNLEDARIAGFEATAEWISRNPRLSIRSGYTYLDSEDHSTGEPLPFRSKHLLILGGDALVYGPFSIGADFRYSSKPEQVDSDFALFVPDADQLVDTRLLDLRVSYEAGAFLVRLLLKNATDYYYIERVALFGTPRRIEIQLGWTI